MELNPENPELLHFLGKVNIDAERFYDAGRCFAKLVELEPDNLQNLLALGKCLSEGGEHETAISVFERVLNWSQRMEQQHYNLAHLTETETGDTAESSPTFR